VAITTAVILAAGRGTRLGLDIPKGLLALAGQQLVPRSISLLRACGVQRIVVVTGFEAGHYEAELGTEPDVVLVRNHNLESGSVISLQAAADVVEDDFLLLESDLVYESRALSILLHHPEANVVLATRSCDAGDEVWLQTQHGMLRALSKDAAAVGHPEAVLVGITKVSRELLEAMVAVAEPSMEYEHALVAAPVPVSVEVADVVWAEIDDAAQLDRARDIVVPLLQETGEWDPAAVTEDAGTTWIP
jgi:choline kinase